MRAILTEPAKYGATPDDGGMHGCGHARRLKSCRSKTDLNPKVLSSNGLVALAVMRV
jgi:hypothetical protein